jgi:hypothetical protein
MQPKIILSPAWAAQEGMLDSALASLFDVDLTNILASTEHNRCPRCDNPPGDSNVQLLTDEPATATPERVSGHVIVRCLCGSVYAFAYVHEVNAQQPVGEAQVRAASATTARQAETTTIVPATGALTISASEAVTVTDFVSIIPGIPSAESFGQATLS